MTVRKKRDLERPIYVISIAAELAGVHPQTLRVYERKGIISPQRTSGNSRRYSERDIEILRRVQELTNEGVNLAGVMRIMELEDRLRDLEARHDEALDEIQDLRDRLAEARNRPDPAGMVPFKDVRRVRRAMKVDLVMRPESGRGPFIAPPVSED